MDYANDEARSIAGPGFAVQCQRSQRTTVERRVALAPFFVTVIT